MGKWWLEKPHRMVQTNLREIDAGLDPDAYFKSLREFSASVVLFNVGGIAANYPTDLPFHHRNPHLKDDLVGKVLARAKAEGLRFIARFDFSKVNEAIARDHGDWLYRDADGREVNYNGQVHACVNGGYQQEKSIEILGEALSRYRFDGVFFNMIGYQTHDYSGNYHGICRCASCSKSFREAAGMDLPASEDPSDPAHAAYGKFKRDTAGALMRRIGAFIRKHGEDIAVCTYTHTGVDIYRKESNTGIDRPLPEWTHAASDNVKSVLGSWPDMAASSTAVHFIDIPYRHSAVSPHLTTARLAGALAAGGWVDLYVIGTIEGQHDRLCFEAAKKVFKFHADNEQWLTGTRTASDACLIAGAGDGAEYRGLYRILTEAHILFDVMEAEALGDAGAADRLAGYRAVVLPGSPAGFVPVLDSYLRNGGRLLVTGYAAQEDPVPGWLGVARVGARRSPGLAGPTRGRNGWPRIHGAYFRVRPGDRGALPGFADLDTLYLDSDVLECVPSPGTAAFLGLIPGCMYGPPEKCYWTEETDIPGLIVAETGKGKCAYLPWRPGAQYVKLAHPGLARLVVGALSGPLGFQGSLETDASPLVEVTAHAGKSGRWSWLGLVNHSGQLGTAFHAPVTMNNIRIGLATKGRVHRVRALNLGANLACESREGRTEFILPRLGVFEVVVIETGP